MIEPAAVVPYGRAATAALAAVVADAQRDDPLAPVTVIVPSNFVGLSARRLLARGVGGPAGGRGVANVAFVTPFQLVEAVGADLLPDTRPLTSPVLGAAVRRTLATEPGPFAPVAGHEATEAALTALFAELSTVDEAGIEAILDEGSDAARYAVEFHRSIAARLVGFHTDHDLALAAAGRSDLADRLRASGHLVWYLPAPLPPALAQFVDRALTEAAASSVVVGLTGDAEADEPVRRTCAAAGVGLGAVPPLDPPTGDRIVSVTDAAEEVREVCRRIIELIERGVAPERIGVFAPSLDPYARIIEQRFAEAGLDVNGPDQRRLADSVAGRTLLRALELPDARWRRDRVMALVSTGPLRMGGTRVHPIAWDELSRDAGVVADLSDWRVKLDRHRSATQHRLDELGPDADEWRLRRLTDRLADNAALRAFVDGLDRLVRTVERARSWADRSAAASTMLVELLGPEHQHATWPEAEQEAFAAVEAALARLAALDDIEPSPTGAVFVRALRAELDTSRGRTGRFGHGVAFGALPSAIGYDLDAVFVLGAAEGLLPVPRRDDATLPDDVRRSALDQLESRAAQLHHQHRAFLAALAAAPAGRRTITFPRGDLRSNRRSLPSRWLLDTASALAGCTVHATDFATLGADVVDVVDSFAAGIAGPGHATSVAERDVVELGGFVAAGGDPVGHPLARLAGAGLLLQRSRAGSAFTEFDGNLAAIAVRDRSLFATDDLHSPTRLESWAECGFRYFLARVLHLADRDDPERTDDISALDRGSLVHSVLERFVREAISAGAPAAAQPWAPADRERLHEIADEVCEQYEAAGRTGRAVNWRVRRADLRVMLDRWLAADAEFRRTRGATPIEVEVGFGIDGTPPVEIELADGSRISLRGQADRLDVTADGRVIVTDYKTGRGSKYRKLDDDPFAGGTVLQLGAYAEGARARSESGAAYAAYWLVEQADAPLLGYDWTPELRSRFTTIVGAIARGVDAGVFAAVPGDWDAWRMTNTNCRYCDFDDLCVRDRGEQAVAKAAAPELAVRVELVPPAARPDAEAQR